MDDATIEKLEFFTVMGVGYQLETPTGEVVGVIRDGWFLHLNDGGRIRLKIDPGACGEDLINNTRQALREHYGQMLEAANTADYYDAITS